METLPQLTSFFRKKANFFDRWAPNYDGLLTTIFYQTVHQRLLEFVQLSPQARVLDLGCGTGKLLQRLARRYPQMQGIGLDLSPQMLRLARKTNRFHPRLMFITGNAEALPFSDRQFEAVFNCISFLHYPHPQQVFQEVARVLAPQGYFYLADFSPLMGQSRVAFSPGGIRFYTPNQREAFAKQAGLRPVAHQYLLTSVVGSIFQKPSLYP